MPSRAHAEQSAGANSAREATNGPVTSGSAGSIQWHLHSNPEQWQEASDILSGEQWLAIDVERGSGYTYSERAYLIQARTESSTVCLIDPVPADSDPGDPKENGLPGGFATTISHTLSNRTLIVHSATQDLPSLRDLKIFPSRIVDTELAGRIIGHPKVNLAAMVELYLDIVLAKEHGAANWSRRPLPPEWLDYAALDVIYLHELAKAMLQEVDKMGRLHWLEQECEHIRSTPAAPVQAEPWRRLSRLSSLRSSRQLARARSLWQVRDRIAREADTNPKKVVPDAALVSAASVRPTSKYELLQIEGLNGHRRHRYASAWLQALDEADAMDSEELPIVRGVQSDFPPHTAWRKSWPQAADLLVAVREAMTTLSDELSIAPEILLKPAALRSWVWAIAGDPDVPSNPPADPYVPLEESLHNAFDSVSARPWQREIVQEPLLDAVSDFYST